MEWNSKTKTEETTKKYSLAALGTRLISFLTERGKVFLVDARDFFDAFGGSQRAHFLDDSVIQLIFKIIQTVRHCFVENFADFLLEDFTNNMLHIFLQKTK